MCNCKIKNELEVDEDTLTALIQSDEDFSIVSGNGIYRVSRRNDAFMRFLYQERKQIMTQNIKINKDEKQWSLV